MRQFLMTSIVCSSCLMVLLGYQNCTKTHSAKVAKHVVTMNK